MDGGREAVWRNANWREGGSLRTLSSEGISAEQREFPLIRQVIVTQDISAAVVGGDLEVTVIEGEPTIYDLQHFDVLATEEEGAGLHIAVGIDTAFHMEIHRMGFPAPGLTEPV